jgi:hypothetical protein
MSPYQKFYKLKYCKTNSYFNEVFRFDIESFEWSYNIDITNDIDFLDITIKCQTTDNTYCNQKRISRRYIMKLKNEHIFNFVRYTFEDLYMAFYIKYLIKIDDEKAKEKFEFMFEKDLSEIVNKIRGQQSNEQLIKNNN